MNEIVEEGLVGSGVGVDVGEVKQPAGFELGALVELLEGAGGEAGFVQQGRDGLGDEAVAAGEDDIDLFEIFGQGFLVGEVCAQAAGEGSDEQTGVDEAAVGDEAAAGDIDIFGAPDLAAEITDAGVGGSAHAGGAAVVG